MKKVINLFIVAAFFVSLSSCGGPKYDVAESNAENGVITDETTLEETSVTDEENLASMNETCYEGNMDGDLIIISVSIDKGVVKGTQYHMIDGIVGEECTVKGKFVEGEFDVALEVLEPRSGEVMETKNEIWTLLEDQIEKTKTKLDYEKITLSKADCR